MTPTLETLYVVWLRKASGWTPGATPEVLRIQEEHLAHLAQLGEEGKALVTGPFLDGSDPRGMIILRAPDVNTARAWAEDDPAVQSGRLSVEIRPWGVLPNVFPNHLAPTTS